MGLAVQSRSLVRGAKSLAGVVFLATTLSGIVLAAQDGPKVVDGGVPTLHVYTNLIQVPTLVLWPSHDLIRKPIAESRFSVSIDSGPWFRATHVRQEGEDPISLSILLDLSGNTAVLMPRMASAVAKLAPTSLQSRDRVSVFALDCSLFRPLHNAPADSVSLKSAVDTAMEWWKARKSNKHAQTCEQKMHLWDALAEVAVELSSLPGRRVVLLVTDGHDDGSKHPWDEVMNYAQSQGVAVFGLRYVPEPSISGGGTGSRRGGGAYLPSVGASADPERPLLLLCELSGGVVTTTGDPSLLHDTLEKFVTMLRLRYIVEFPRPSNSTPGEHDMQVKIAKDDYLIRPAGVSLPIADARLMADPTTIQAGPALAPEQGTRKVMTKPQ